MHTEVNKKTDLAVSHKGAMFSESACMTIFGTLGIVVLGNKVLITYYKIARCRSYSHVLWTMISRRCACRVRSLLAVVRSQRMCIPTFRTFPYRIPGRLAKVPSAFVGGTPLICSPRHRDMFHFLIC